VRKASITNKYKSIRVKRSKARVVFGEYIMWCDVCLDYAPYNRTSCEWTCAVCGAVNSRSPEAERI
jgi:epoxyqueuosine reductase QueG